MNFEAIERRAKEVARDAATEQVKNLRVKVAEMAGMNGGVWGPPEDFTKAFQPLAAYLQKEFTDRNVRAYHAQAEQAAIDTLRGIINQPTHTKP